MHDQCGEFIGDKYQWSVQVTKHNTFSYLQCLDMVTSDGDELKVTNISLF